MTDKSRSFKHAEGSSKDAEGSPKNAESSGLARDFYWIVCAYVVALIVAGIALAVFDAWGPLWRAAWADVAATLAIFAFGYAFKNSSFYDAYWSVAPPVLMLYWMVTYDSFDARAFLLFTLVFLWALRLTHNWARGWQGLTHQDWRYVDLKEKTGAFYPLVDLFGIQLLPTVLVFAGCVSVWLVLQASSTSLELVDMIWIVIGFSALWLEYRADNVLRQHRLDPSNQGQVLKADVWSWCRHPNYLGELGFWLALAICGYQVSSNPYAWLGFALMVGLFVGISIPMIDKRQLANKPGYAAYKAEVGTLIPGIKW